jgi:hypothetical protein
MVLKEISGSKEPQAGLLVCQISKHALTVVYSNAYEFHKITLKRKDLEPSIKYEYVVHYSPLVPLQLAMKLRK